MSSSRITRSSIHTLFCGGSSDLPKTHLPTYKELIHYHYFLRNSNPQMDHSAIYDTIAGDVRSIWAAVNPNLPLIKEYSIMKKIQNLFKKVNDINWKKANKRMKEDLTKKLDTLFDIAACTCDLPIVDCTHALIKCKVKTCKKEHIICNCPKEARVPLIERAYLKDQRTKTDPKGNFQLSTRERVHLKKSNHSPGIQNSNDDSMQTDFSSETSSTEDLEVSKIILK